MYCILTATSLKTVVISIFTSWQWTRNCITSVATTAGCCRRQVGCGWIGRGWRGRPAAVARRWVELTARVLDLQDAIGRQETYHAFNIGGERQIDACCLKSCTIFWPPSPVTSRFASTVRRRSLFSVTLMLSGKNSRTSKLTLKQRRAVGLTSPTHLSPVCCWSTFGCATSARRRKSSAGCGSPALPSCSGALYVLTR